MFDLITKPGHGGGGIAPQNPILEPRWDHFSSSTQTPSPPPQSPVENGRKKFSFLPHAARDTIDKYE